MARPPEHSVPPSQPTPFRHLGLGSAGGGPDRPMRVQLAAALVLGLIVVAVPLYLWRRPKAATATDTPDGGASSAPIEAGPPPDPTRDLVAAALDGGVQAEGVTLGKVWIDSCQRPGAGKTPPEQCDRQPFFEQALVKAVLENTSCVPRLGKSGSISFALRVDYQRKQMNVFAGRSGTLRRKQAAEVIKCVQRSLPTPDWQSLAHQHTRYVIAVLATYPPSDRANSQ